MRQGSVIYNKYKKLVHKLYLIDLLSPKQISDIIPLSMYIIQNNLRKDGIIRTRNQVADLLTSTVYENNKKQIHKMYLDDLMSASTIGKFFGVSKRPILKGLHKDKLIRTNLEGLRISFQKRNTVWRRKSTPEKAVSDYLSLKDIPFIEQYVIPGRRYVYDFYLYDMNTLLEVDGEYWHRLGKYSSLPDAEKIHTTDKDKTNVALSNNYKLIRITDEQLLKNGTDLLDKIFMNS